jgi:hypothetical protein
VNHKKAENRWQDPKGRHELQVYHAGFIGTNRFLRKPNGELETSGFQNTLGDSAADKRHYSPNIVE